MLPPAKPLRRITAGALLAAAALGACARGDAERARPAAATSAAAAPARPSKVELTPAPEGEDVATLVRRELERARADGRELVVYVGASWCEPCRRFHEAARDGELDAAFPTLRLVEFDLDRDDARLRAAGYASKMIPLFAAPGADGRATGLQIEGSIKGDGAVAQIAPRLERMLEKARGGG
jgi:thiol-disulfide isomerase/thioredoxin